MAALDIRQSNLAFFNKARLDNQLARVEKGLPVQHYVGTASTKWCAPTTATLELAFQP